MINLLWNVLREDEAQDIAEYAVMLAVILVIVVGTIRILRGEVTGFSGGLGRGFCVAELGKGAFTRLFLIIGASSYAASDVASSSWSMERIWSRSSGLSSWPCTVLACRTARSRASPSVPEMTIEQGFSVGKRRQSITLRFSAIVPPWETWGL